MIATDTELEATQQRIVYFQRLLSQMRVAARPDEFPAMAGAYVAEVEKMHREVMDYLTRHASVQPTTAAPPTATSPTQPIEPSHVPAAR